MAVEGTARERGQCAPVYNGRIRLKFLPIYVNKCVKKIKEGRFDRSKRREIEYAAVRSRKVDRPHHGTTFGRTHRTRQTPPPLAPVNQACLSLPPAHPPALSLLPLPMFCLDEQIQALVARLSLATEAEGAASKSS